MSADVPGSLSAFIRTHDREIIAAFSTFAQTLMPPGSGMTQQDLEDHCDALLRELADDLDSEQTDGEQIEKAEGRGTAHRMRASGQAHADGRLHHGFRLTEVVAEFRALRASVLRLYERSGQADLAGIRRFNESLDEALAESVARYSDQRDLYRDQFIGILSHDLRGPLAAITAGAAFLMRAGDSDRLRREHTASRILSSAQRMGRMIADLLDFTRMRLGGTIPLRRTAADLRAICEDVLLEIQAGRPDADVRLACEGDTSGAWDADRLAQVVTNLVVNALEHGGKVPVAVTARADTTHVVLSVHNDGPPIPRDVQGTVFEPLVRGDSQAGQNVGLGLFIARSVVSAHGGEIQLTSAASTGTTFTVRLPREVP